MFKKMLLVAALAATPFIAGTANAASCVGTPNEFSVLYTFSGDAADCGTLDITAGPIDIDATFHSTFGAPGEASLTFEAAGAPSASGSVSVLLNGITAANIVSATFGGSAVSFIAFPNGLGAGLDATLPATFVLNLTGLDDSATFTVQLQPIPLPAAAFLLLGGLGGLAALKRRKKA